MTFYLRDIVFNRAELTMHMDDPYLGQLPIKREPKEKQAQLVKLVDETIALQHELNSTERTIYNCKEYDSMVKELQYHLSAIDNFVYDVYGLTMEQRSKIEELIPYW